MVCIVLKKVYQKSKQNGRIQVDSRGCRRFGYSRVRIKAMAEDYKSGKIDIFGPMDKKKFDKQFKEVDQLKARVAELEEALKMSKIKAEGYEIMMRIIQEEYGIDLPKKVEAKQSANSKSDIRK